MHQDTYNTPLEHNRNQELVDHITAHEPVKFAALADLFCAKPLTTTGIKRLRARLSYLVDVGRITVSGETHQRAWSGPDHAVAPPSTKRAMALHPASKPHLGQVVPPAQYDVMRAPPWRPGPGPVMRPGAMDHLAARSVGVRC